MSWKSELDFLRRRCDERVAPELPSAVREWFDFNRNDDPPPREYLAGLMDRISASKDEHDLGDWRYHTDAYGWRLLLQPYARDGRRYYLLMVERPTKASDRDDANLDRMIRYLGGDPEAHYLLTTRGADDPDEQFLYTWPMPLS